MAALGDALVSAQGALSTDITTAGKQYRGVSFATGKLQKIGHDLRKLKCLKLELSRCQH